MADQQPRSWLTFRERRHRSLPPWTVTRWPSEVGRVRITKKENKGRINKRIAETGRLVIDVPIAPNAVGQALLGFGLDALGQVQRVLDAAHGRSLVAPRQCDVRPGAAGGCLQCRAV